MPVCEIPLDPESQKRRLFFWAETDGKLDDFTSWVSSRPRSEQESLARLLRRCVCHTFPLLHPSSERFKKEFDHGNDGIWAIKSFQIRIFGVNRGLDFYIVHYLLKKNNKLSKNDIKTTKEKHAKFITEEKKTGEKNERDFRQYPGRCSERRTAF